MEPEIKNFTQVENFIQTQPQQADAKAQAWNVFVSQHPTVSHFQSEEEFVAWARTHNVSDTTIWLGKEVQDAYFYIRQKYEEEQEAEEMEHTGHVSNHNVPAALTTLRFLNNLVWRPKILEEDPKFRKLLGEKYDTWKKDHPGQDETSKEWIDYRYGSLENPEADTLYKDAEKAFRNGEDLGEKASEKEKAQRQKKVTSYDEERKKIYKNPQDDPTLTWHQEEIDIHAEARHKLLQKTNPEIKIEDVQKEVAASHWNRFVETHPEKAEAYAAKHEEIQKALTTIKEKRAIQEQLKQYQQTTGKEIKYVENKKHSTPITPPLPIPILQKPITPPSLGLVDAQGRPLGSIPSISRPTPLQPLRIQRPIFNQSQPAVGQSIPRINRQIPYPSSRGVPLPGVGGIGNFLRNPLGSIMPGLGGNNLLTNLARQAGARVATFLLSLLNPVSGTVIVSLVLTLILTLSFYSATTGEASPLENNTSNIPSTTLIIPSGNPSSNQASANSQADFLFKNRSSNIPIYQEASAATGVPWEVLAGIHFMEGGFNPNGSLVSGRTIGTNEPDVRSCSYSPQGPGIPVPLPSGGCGFNTLLDSAIYAGNHLKGKVNDALSSFESTATALSRYNGGGNRNCDNQPPYQRRSPYTGCPRLYEGEDDPYVFSFFDSRHDSMYLIYCADLQTCNPPRQFGRPGIMTIIKAIQDYKQ